MASVRGHTAFVVRSLAGANGTSPAESLLRLLFLCMGLRDAGASQVVAVVPYLAFARKDRRTQPRDPVTARYVAQLIEAAGVSQVLALDAHNPAAFDNAFRIPAAHLTALPLLAGRLCEHIDSAGMVVASPDVGGIKRAQLFCELLARQCGAPIGLAFIEKRRAAGALHVEVAVTHVPLQDGLAALLAAPEIAGVLVTDSVGRDSPPQDPRLTILTVAPLLASAMQRIATGRPLTPLAEHWPPAG